MKNEYLALTTITAILIIIISIVPQLSPSKSYAEGERFHIPPWEKNVANWWANGMISDSDFLQGIQYLLAKEIMKISETEVGSSYSPEIPPWIKIDAKLWSNGKLGDSTFVQGIQYLIQTGFIKLPKTQAQNQTVDLGVNPTVWFAPRPAKEGSQYVHSNSSKPLTGGQQLISSRDFMELFTENAPWQNAEQHVQIFKLYLGWVITANDFELNQTVTYLNNHKIAIAIEAGPLESTSTCGKGVEGYGGKEQSLYAINRIKQAGGVVRYIALDEPFYYGSLYDGPNSCHWSILKVANAVKEYVRFIKRMFPDTVIGDVEPITARSGAIQYENWLKIYWAVAGSNLPFFHLDTDVDSQPNWPIVNKELETFCREHKIEFGMIYFGNFNASSDDEWLDQAEKRIVTYEVEAGGRPQHVIFQSWQPHPFYVLPETSPHTFTHLILSYFKPRTVLNIITTSESSGMLLVNGKLTQLDGKPIAGSSIELFRGSVSGSGIFVKSDGLPVDSTETDKDGAFYFRLKEIKSDTILQARYSGDENHWPSYIEIQIH